MKQGGTGQTEKIPSRVVAAKWVFEAGKIGAEKGRAERI